MQNSLPANKITKYQRISDMMALSALILSVLAILIVVIGTINRGFDITDEGSLLLTYEYTDIYPGGVHNYHLVINKLFGWINPNIITYRILTLVFCLLSSFVLGYGFYRWIGNSYPSYNKLFKNFTFILLFVFLGSLLYYFMGLQIIHHNTLTNFLLQANTGILLIILSRNPKEVSKKKTFQSLIISIGFVCAMSFFIKFPTALLQLSISVILIVFFLRKMPLKHIFVASCSLLVGFVIGIIWYSLFVQNISEWFTDFIFEYNMFSDHNPRLVLYRYCKDIAKLLLFMSSSSFLLISIIALLLSRLYIASQDREAKWDKYFNGIAITAMIVLFLLEVYEKGFFRSAFRVAGWASAYAYIAVIMVQLSVLIGMKWAKINGSFLVNVTFLNKLVVCTLLIITPFIGAFGTANIIFLNVLLHIAPWFALILLLNIELSECHLHPCLLLAFIVIPAIITLTQVVDGNTLSPLYSCATANKASIFEQTEEIEEIPRAKGILIDKETKDFILELDDIFRRNHFREGWPIFCYNMPGIVYLLGGISPGVPCFFGTERDRMGLSLFNPEVHSENSLPIVMLHDNDGIGLIKDDNRINFPNGYKQIGELYNPYRRTMLRIYFPIK